MLTPTQIEDIEYEIINDYLHDLYANTYSSERITGDLAIRTDVDDYDIVPGVCNIPGRVIKEWVTGNFDTLIEEYLWKSGKKTTISDLAEPKDLVDRESFIDFLMDQLDNIEEYFWSSDMYSEFCKEYFEEYAEEDDSYYGPEDD